MRALIIYPTDNQIKNDAKGAFIPEALAFGKRRRELGDTTIEYTFTPKSFTRASLPKLYDAIESSTCSTVAIFSHGIATALPQLHLRREDCPQLAESINKALHPGERANIILYCCLTALPLTGGRNFAETLAHNLQAMGRPFDLWAHRTAGHTTRNPNISLYYSPVIVPGDTLASRETVRLDYPRALADLEPRFKKRLADYGDTYRFDYPFELPAQSPRVAIK